MIGADAAGSWAMSNERAGAGPDTAMWGGAFRIGRRCLLHALAAAPFWSLVGAGSASAAASRPFSARVVQSGHSLTDPVVPVLEAMVARAGGAAARGGVVVRSTIPGSPMDWRWSHAVTSPQDARHGIAGFDVLVITERAPLSGTIAWHDSHAMALRWFIHALSEGAGGAGSETILYATWVNTDSGPRFANPANDPDGHLHFRERLPREMAHWQSIADHVNRHRPAGAPPLRVIPGPLLMAAVYDAIAARQAPGLTRVEDLFSDVIHLNGFGAYLVALAHFAVIYGRDPRSLGGALLGRVEVPPPETAAWMQQTVHEVLRDYRDAGYAPQG